MIKVRYFLFIALFLLIPVLVFAQDSLLVLEDYSHNGSIYLNTQLANDSSSIAFTTGHRVYVLRKDGVYLYNNAYATYQGKRVKFVTSPTDAGYYSNGQNPEAYGVIGTNSKLPGYLIDMAHGGKVELHNINVSDYYCGDVGGSDSMIALQQGGIIHIGTGGGIGTIFLDSCTLHGTNGNHIRTDGTTDTVIVTNTIFSDMGNVFPSNFGAGKAFDLRDVDIAYCKIQNCTFINAQDRIVRHYTAKQPIHNFIFDHNTVVNAMSYHGFLSLGKVDSTGTGTLQITNNLLVDHFALGADTAYVRQVEFSDPGEMDPINNQPRMAWVLTNYNNAAAWNIQKNYYAITDSGAAVRSLTAAQGYYQRPYTGEDPFLTHNMNKVLASQSKDTTTTFTKVKVKVLSAPPLMTQMIRWVFTARGTAMSGSFSNPCTLLGLDPNYVPTGTPFAWNAQGDGKQKNTGDSYYTQSKIKTGIYGVDYNRRSLAWYDSWKLYGTGLVGTGTLNCSYSASVNLATAGTDGKTIGDTRWSFTATSVLGSTQSPNKYSLSQNYPNPFNPSTNFTINVKERGLVQVKIFDILGREITTLVNEVKEIGSYPITWNAAAMSSGVYFYQLKAGNFVDTKKMVLLK
jgi:hypothetical protein